MVFTHSMFLGPNTPESLFILCEPLTVIALCPVQITHAWVLFPHLKVCREPQYLLYC